MDKPLLETVTDAEATPVASVIGTETVNVPFSYKAAGVTAIEKLFRTGGAVSATTAAVTCTFFVAVSALYVASARRVPESVQVPTDTAVTLSPERVQTDGVNDA